MVVVVVASDGCQGVKGSPNQYSSYPVEVNPAVNYPDSGCSSDGKECDSDGCSNSEGDSTRLEDSGVYSADGDSINLSSPSPHAYDDQTIIKGPRKSCATYREHCFLSNRALLQHQYQLNSQQQHRSLNYPQPPQQQQQQQQHAYHSLDEIRREPKTHPTVEAPLCIQCCRMDVSFFDPSCGGCWSLLKRPDTTPAHIFAVLRQWVPQVQRAIHLLVNMALSIGCGLADRDALTDMTLLHYAVKAGSGGVGDPSLALEVVEELIDRGADVHQRCKWTHMTALHYAAYFDVVPVLKLLLSLPQGVNVDDPCAEYDLGTPLHIAAANLCLGAAHVLLIHGASRVIKDARGRTPKECIPLKEQYELVPDVQDLIDKFIYLLSGVCSQPHINNGMGSPSQNSVSGKAVLQALGLKLGDRVLVSGVKTGSLRYIGPTEFATGLWAGVELETPTGRHNGCVKGVLYFRCGHNYGIFVPVNRLTKIPNVNGGGYSHTLGRSRRRGRAPSASQRRSPSKEPPARRSLSLPPGKVNHGKVDISRVSSRIKQDINNTKRKLVVGDRVFVDMGMDCGGPRAAIGVVRYTGAVHFASGYWIGVELDEPRGANDGKVQGNRYFTCRQQHGVLAVPSRVIKVSGDADLSLMSHEPRFESPRQCSKSLSKTRQSECEKERSRNVRNSSSRSTIAHCSVSPVRKSLSSQHTANMAHSYHGMIPTNKIVNDIYEPSNLLGSIKRATSLKNAFYPPNTSMTNLNRSFSARYESARLRQEEFARRQEAAKKEPQWQKAPVIAQQTRQARDEETQKHWLEIGHNVFYKNMIGIIKYIGYVHFEDGKWLGIELRNKKGRHDGFVQGQRYFYCKPNHGLMVRPSKVTVRGLNGADLVKPDDEFDHYYED